MLPEGSLGAHFKAATTSRVCDSTLEKKGTLSIYKCFFCDTYLDGQAKMLDCFHLTCNNCVEEKMSDTGLQCTCGTITKKVILDYPCVSPDVPINKICDADNCDSVVNKKCIKCEKYYCELCSEVHINRYENHYSRFMVNYPTKNEYILCSICFEKYIEVLCIPCSKLTCSLCFLTSHREHDFKFLEHLKTEINEHLSAELTKLKNNDAFLVFYTNKIKEKVQKLESEKKSIIDQVDTVMKMLQDETNKRALELKDLAARYFKENDAKVYENKEQLLLSQKKISYSMKLARTILQLDSDYPIMMISKAIIQKQDDLNKSIPDQVTELEFDMQFSDDTLKDCISAIHSIGNINSTSEINDIGTSGNISQHFINLQPTNSNNEHTVLEEIPNDGSDDDSDSSASSEYEPLSMCSCCNQLTAVKLIQCFSCNRLFHNDCHIPPILINIQDYDPLKINWKCTLCHDITKYAKVLNQRDLDGIIPVFQTELKIMERILMELYCQNDDSEHYRELPNEELYPIYYQIVHHPISLNDIKNTLESEQSYTSLNQFLYDIKQVFTNGQLYYSSNDPYCLSANNLLASLKRMVNRWIPRLRSF